MKKNLILAAIPFLFLAISAYCQDDPKELVKEVRSISGSVSDTDIVSSKIVINADNGKIAISIPEGIPLMRGAEQISIDDIEIGDLLTLEYYSPSPGKYIAVSVRDDNLAGE